MRKESFQVSDISLVDVELGQNSISYEYSIDGFTSRLRFDYGPIDVRAAFPHDDALYSYAVSLGVVSLAKFGAVIPKRVDLQKYSPWIHPSILTFLHNVLPRHWSEHRYQLGRLDYRTPEFVVDSGSLGSTVRLPFTHVAGKAGHKALLATGSGKDSLLCELILQKAGVEYESFTYLHDKYGDMEHQLHVFERVPNSRSDETRHVIGIYDDYYHWLEERMKACGLTETVRVQGQDKPFRTESGEVFLNSFAMAPVQSARGIAVQVYGNEKSADFPNMTDAATGENVAHQFAKSISAEAEVYKLYKQVFGNIRRVSITKPMFDVRIFTTLFALGGDLPYMTNSCNFTKPWCRRCEKCLYVFAGFSAFGDHAKTVEAFGEDIFNVPDALPVWEDLLGLHGRIAWECVGHPEEAQLYLYKTWQSDIRGCAIDMFISRVIEPLREQGFGPGQIDKHFAQIEEKYSAIDPKHHHMPSWLADKVLNVIDESAFAPVTNA